VNGTLFFRANDGTSGNELWKSNGTDAGTVLVKDIRSGSDGSYGRYLTNVNGTLFFKAANGTNGQELWKSNGTEAGTVLVKDIRSGSFSSYPHHLTNVNGTLFFRADDGTGDELWKSDGTDTGTVRVKDINSGGGRSNPRYLTNVNGTLFFRATNGTNGEELWKSDGTEAGTVLVKDIGSGGSSSYPRELTNVNGTLFFRAYDVTNGYELWKSDGTDTGTVRVKDIRSGSYHSNPDYLTNVNGTLFFRANDGTGGTELWKSDGTDSGTVRVKDINSGSGDSIPRLLTNVDGTLFFRANNGTNGEELWKSNGTEAGTVLVKDIGSGSSSSNPRYLTNVDGTLFFRANNGTNGEELWKSNGTDAGTVLVKDIRSGSSGSNLYYLTNVNGTLFFRANNGTNGEELWKSNGTEAGTVLVKDIRSGSSGSGLSSLTNMNGKLFFIANDGTSGAELWSWINEAPTDIVSSSTSIAENDVANATVGTLSTTDPDEGDSFTYSLVSGTGDTDNAAFNILGSTLRATSGFDFETKNSYSVRIRSTDQGGLFTEKIFTITVTNVNETPTDIALSANSIAENAGANATVGTLSTTDPDASNSFTYSLVSGTGDADNTAFNISGNTLRATSGFDFETKNSYSVRIRSTDQGGLFTEKVFTITVTNVNETPTDIALSATSIAENAGANATVGTLSTTDPDVGNTFTYTFVSGTGDADNTAFNILGNSLRATSGFDFETKSSYSVRIRSTDQGGLFTEKVFTITVINAPELVSVNINGADSFANPSQRSQLTSLVVTTDLPLTDPATAFTLTNIGLYTASESSLAASQILVTHVGNVYTLRFGPGSGVVTRGGTGIRGNSLADGNWVLKISPTQVTGSNQYGHRAVDKFFRMYGDSDGDGDVDGADVLALRRAQVAASYNAALDWDGNGSVSAGVDLSNFSLNQNKRRRSF
jgi:ELWxxDGT repeat protein